MAAAKKYFTIEQKATFKKRFIYRDSLKTPINLTGFSARMQIRGIDGTLISDLSTTNGKILLGGPTGTIDLIIPAAETSPMVFTNALYDLKIISASGTETRLLEGRISVSPGQTE